MIGSRSRKFLSTIFPGRRVRGQEAAASGPVGFHRYWSCLPSGDEESHNKSSPMLFATRLNTELDALDAEFLKVEFAKKGDVGEVLPLPETQECAERAPKSRRC